MTRDVPTNDATPKQSVLTFSFILHENGTFDSQSYVYHSIPFLSIGIDNEIIGWYIKTHLHIYGQQGNEMHSVWK